MLQDREEVKERMGTFKSLTSVWKKSNTQQVSLIEENNVSPHITNLYINNQTENDINKQQYLPPGCEFNYDFNSQQMDVRP
ncbi:MAG: hypothetical protein ACMG6E_03190 [Candidatus Roizmanbacteria bacterium]